MAIRVGSLFQSDRINKMELRSDLSAIQKEWTENPEYHDGDLTYFTPGAEPVKLFLRLWQSELIKQEFLSNCETREDYGLGVTDTESVY